MAFRTLEICPDPVRGLRVRKWFWTDYFARLRGERRSSPVALNTLDSVVAEMIAATQRNPRIEGGSK